MKSVDDVLAEVGFVIVVAIAISGAAMCWFISGLRE